MWTNPSDVSDKVKRWWDEGELLSEIASNVSTFPRTINFKKPSSNELSHNYDEVRQWISAINSIKSGEILLQEVNHRIVGRNKIPVAIRFSSHHDAIALIGRKNESKKFEKLVEKIKGRKPVILPWIIKHPHDALALESDWDKLIDILTWFETHPDRRIYLRQVDVPNVHTKMLEEHKTTLLELLSYLFSESDRPNKSSANKDFESRYGFLSKPLRIRFRIVDPDRSIVTTNQHIQDITLDAATFESIDPQIKYVYIIENEINFLAFPALKDALVIFGSGYGFENLSRATWLLKHKIFYWGDIDTHGLNILNSARKFLPHLRSIMMDDATLVSHRDHWVEEQKPFRAVHLDRLTETEHVLYDKLRTDYFGPNIRLEQEKLSWTFVEQEINRTVISNSELGRSDDLPDKPIEKSHRFSDYDISNFVHPSICRLRAYLSAHAPINSEDRPFNAIEEILRRQIQKLRMNARTQFCDALDVSQHERHERILASLEAVKGQTLHILGPMLSATTKIDGCDCELASEADILIRENDGYVVRNLSTSRKLSNIDTHSSVIKLQLFGWLLWKLTNELPARLELQNSEGEVTCIKFDFGCAALRKIAEIYCIRALPTAPYSPVGWTKCSGCDYQQTCWSKAKSESDVAMIAGIDQKLANTLHRLGNNSIPSLVENFDIPALAELRKSDGEKHNRVGKSAAESILCMAQANLSQRHLLRKPPELPELSKYAIIDLEGLPAFAPNSDFVFLWGLQIFGVEDSKYECAFSPSFDSEYDRNAWFQFLKICEQVFQIHGPIPILHWHHYERTKLERYIENYGDWGDTGRRVIDRLVDLLPIVQQSVALPTPSYSLKVVERYVGFERQQKQFGGDWVMSKYLEYIASTDDCQRGDLQRQICLYNEEDILATDAVLTWLRAIEF